MNIFDFLIISINILLMQRLLTKGLNLQAFAVEKKLFIYDKGVNDLEMHQSINSGIRATIFGASGFIGKSVCARLGQLGCSMIMPINLEFHYRHSEHLKQLKTLGATHKTWVEWDMNYKNEKMIERMVENSNVVINLLGPRTRTKKKEDFEFVNIEAAERIARACTKHGVHRLIHFSAAAASPDAESLDFQTKYEGEQVVRKAFPDATIFRPCSVYGLNDHFAGVIRRQVSFFFNHFVTVYDDCTTKKQPLKDHDLAQCVINALKLEESKGKTYELGGPNVLTMLEIHEIMFNLMKIRPAIGYLDRDFFTWLSKYIYNWDFMGMEYLKKKITHEVVNTEKYLTIKDLRVDPVTFKNGVVELLKDYVAEYRENDEDYEN